MISKIPKLNYELLDANVQSGAKMVVLGLTEKQEKVGIIPDAFRELSYLFSKYFKLL